MAAMFNYEGDVYVDLELEVEVRDAQGNELECDADCDGYGKQITVTLDPRYKINNTDTSALKDVKVNAYNSDGNPVPCTVKSQYEDGKESEVTVTLDENYVNLRDLLCASNLTFPMCRIEDEEARLYVQGVDIQAKKAGDDNILVIPKEAIDRLKADLRKEIVQEITSKLFD